MGHDTSGGAERMRDKLKKKAKGFLGKVAVKAYNKAREAKAAAAPAVQRAKTSAKRGIRKMALKVADKLKEENVDEAVYGTAAETRTYRMLVTNADKAGKTLLLIRSTRQVISVTTADHMNEGDGDPCMGHSQASWNEEEGGNRWFLIVFPRMKMDWHPCCLEDRDLKKDVTSRGCSSEEKSNAR